MAPICAGDYFDNASIRCSIQNGAAASRLLDMYDLNGNTVVGKAWHRKATTAAEKPIG